MTQSVRLRLIIFLGGMLVLAWGGIAASSIYSARKEVQELFDAQLVQSARVLNALLQHEMEELSLADQDDHTIVLDLSDPGHIYERKISFRVRGKDGDTWFKSEQAPVLKIKNDDSGFKNILSSDELWRVFVLHNKVYGSTIEVAQSYQIRDELILEISREVIWPFIVAIPFLILMIWLSAGRSLRPLESVAEEVKHRNPQNLEEIDTSNVPTEVLPLFDALNKLLKRLKNALNKERGFTADAAHELRTPLAGIKAQAQVALRASDETEKDRALKYIITGVDHATHLVRQMLMLARLDPDIPKRKFATQDLAAILTEVAADEASQAADKGVELEVHQEAAKMLLEGSAEALSVLIRNLLDNAVRYTHSGGLVKAGVTRSEDGVVLKITDSGPGIAEEDKERVFDRFYRGLGTGQTGSGLGLSIVQRVVDLHQAKIEFKSVVGEGVKVEVTFPVS